jgi:two-component system chemotaxis response regulator CheB
MPVVMISTLTERGAEVTMKALELGAVDFVAKPRVGLASGLNELASQIVDKIRVAAVAHVRRAPSREAAPTGSAQGAGAAPAVPASALLGRLSTEKLICIGASTGGTEAIKEVLVQMPADSPAIVITQHMPAGFTTSFAARLNGLCQITVKEAVNGERILPGHAYICGAQRSELCRRCRRRASGESPQALGGGAVQVRRGSRGPQRFRNHAHGHGERRCGSDAGDEGCR